MNVDLVRKPTQIRLPVNCVHLVRTRMMRDSVKNVLWERIRPLQEQQNVSIVDVEWKSIQQVPCVCSVHQECTHPLMEEDIVNPVQ